MEEELIRSLISQGPLVSILGAAVIALWRHVVKLTEDLKKITEENTKVIAEHNSIYRGLSENLYANLVLKRKEQK